MENRYYKIRADEKRVIVERITAYIKNRPDILFAYLHGSFFSGDRFRDIDIAIYLKPPFSPSLQVELEMEAELDQEVKKYPVEVRVLNNAPLSSEVLSALQRLEDLRKLSEEEFAADPHKVASAKYNLIVAIEGAVDLSNHIISKNGFRTPEDYADTFRVMEEKGVFDAEFPTL